jgi:hypothetical protein
MFCATFPRVSSRNKYTQEIYGVGFFSFIFVRKKNYINNKKYNKIVNDKLKLTFRNP